MFRSAAQKLKEKMLELTRLFLIERSLFQKFVIVYKYIRLLNKDPLAKDILQNIFSDTAKTMGHLDKDCVDEEEFLSVKGEVIYTQDFWIYYSNLELIHAKMKKLKQCKINDKKDYDDLCKLFSKPYSEEMLVLSFKVINSNIFDRLDEECFLKDDDSDEKTWFDEKRSILHIKGERVKINIQDKISNAHKVLKHIFITNKDNLGDEFFYSEMACEEFGDMEYKTRPRNWQKYYIACQEIARKINEQTGGKITDFIVFNTGRKGKVKVNKKYL